MIATIYHLTELNVKTCWRVLILSLVTVFYHATQIFTILSCTVLTYGLFWIIPFLTYDRPNPTGFDYLSMFLKHSLYVWFLIFINNTVMCLAIIVCELKDAMIELFNIIEKVAVALLHPDLDWRTHDVYKMLFRATLDRTPCLRSANSEALTQRFFFPDRWTEAERINIFSLHNIQPTENTHVSSDAPTLQPWRA